MYPPTGERSHLPVRSALGKRHWRLTPPPCPLLRGGAPVSAPALVGPKRCPLGTRTPLAPPRKGPLNLGLWYRGFQKVYLPALTPSGPALPGHLPLRGRQPPSLREVSRLRRDGRSYLKRGCRQRRLGEHESSLTAVQTYYELSSLPLG